MTNTQQSESRYSATDSFDDRIAEAKRRRDEIELQLDNGILGHEENRREENRRLVKEREHLDYHISCLVFAQAVSRASNSSLIVSADG